jgi:hypothetical protein
MAEAAGLVIGAVALGSLFSTCVDAVDCLYHGKNYQVDYRHACARMGMLKYRLSTWGEILNVSSPGHENIRLRLHWLEVQEVVAQSFSAIQDILGSAQILADRYKIPSQSHYGTEVSTSSHCNQTRSRNTRPSASRAATNQRLSLAWRRATWVIQDRQKFDAHLEKLAFFVENLEQVLKRINMSDPPISSEGRKVSDTVQSAENNASSHLQVPSGKSHGSGGSNNGTWSKYTFKNIERCKFLQGDATDVQHSSDSGPSTETFSFESTRASQFYQAPHDAPARAVFLGQPLAGSDKKAKKDSSEGRAEFRCEEEVEVNTTPACGSTTSIP